MDLLTVVFNEIMNNNSGKKTVDIILEDNEQTRKLIEDMSFCIDKVVSVEVDEIER